MGRLRLLSIIPLVIVLTLTGCVATSGQHLDTGCPPNQVRVEDEHTGEYDCATQREYEDMMEVLDEHGRRDRG